MSSATRIRAMNSGSVPRTTGGYAAWPPCSGKSASSTSKSIGCTDYFGNIAPPTGYYALNGSALLPGGRPVRYNTPGAVLVPLAPSVNNQNVRNANDSFFDDIKRG